MFTNTYIYIYINGIEYVLMLVYAMRPPCARHAPMVKVNHRQDKCQFICISHTTHKTPTAIYYII